MLWKCNCCGNEYHAIPRQCPACVERASKGQMYAFGLSLAQKRINREVEEPPLSVPDPWPVGAADVLELIALPVGDLLPEVKARLAKYDALAKRAEEQEKRRHGSSLTEYCPSWQICNNKIVQDLAAMKEGKGNG